MNPDWYNLIKRYECCDGSPVKFLKLEFDYKLPISELIKLTRDRDYILFHAKVFSEECYFHRKGVR